MTIADKEIEALTIDGSIYEGFAAAITGPSGTIAHVREYADAVRIITALNTSRSSQAPEDGLVSRLRKYEQWIPLSRFVRELCGEAADAITALNTSRSSQAPEGVSLSANQALFDAIKHGDAEHRAWLRQAIDCHFAGRPVPAPRSSQAPAVKLLSETLWAIDGTPDDLRAMRDKIIAYLDEQPVPSGSQAPAEDGLVEQLKERAAEIRLAADQRVPSYPPSHTLANYIEQAADALSTKEKAMKEALEKIAERAAKLRQGTDDWFELVEFEAVARAALGEGKK